MSLSIKQILKRIEEFQQSHLQMKDYRYGDVTLHLADSDVKYPALFVDINPVKQDWQNKVTTHTVSFWIADLANVSNATRENEIDVISDLTQIYGDFVLWLTSYQNQEDFVVRNITDGTYILNGNEDAAIILKFDASLDVDLILSENSIPQ